MLRQWIWIGMLVLVGGTLETQADFDARPVDPKDPAEPMKRVALVIGNKDYAPALRNPINDADSIAAALKDCGFTVLKYTNLNRKEMFKAVHAFGDDINPGDVALFYYSGHGFLVQGGHYLIPVDAKIEAEYEVQTECLNVNLVLSVMQNAYSEINILVLDTDLEIPLSGYDLLDIGPVRNGTFIAYATTPGKVAFDGEGSNSPFTGALVRVMREPGLRIEEVFRNVRMKVIEDTAGEQVPWISMSLVEDFYWVAPENDSEAVEVDKDSNFGNFRVKTDEDAEQAYERGLKFYYGYEVKADDGEAEKWFRKAADQGHVDAQIYLRQIDKNRMAVGRKAPDFTLQTLDGKRFNLYENLGKPIFLNFWATWCSPCVAEMPDMEKLQQTLGDSILIVGIDMGESADRVRNFVRDRGFTWTFVLDSEREVAQAYDVSVIPTSLFIDAKGVIVRRFGKRDYETFLEVAREAIDH